MQRSPPLFGDPIDPLLEVFGGNQLIEINARMQHLEYVLGAIRWLRH